MSEKKERKMLNLLKSDTDWHSVQELSIFLDVSDRTVKKYYKTLAENQPVISSKYGYKYNGPSYRKIINESNDDEKIPNTKQERIFYVLNKLISVNSPINIYDLSAEIFTSESNLKLAFGDAENYVKKFDLEIKKQGDYFSILGSESDKRHMLSDMLYKESDGNFINKVAIQENFPEVNVDSLYTITQKFAKKNEIYLNTFDLNNIILHITIAIQRIRNGYQFQTKDNRFNWKSSKFAQELLVEVEKSQKSFKFPDEDLVSLGLVIDGSVSRWTIDMKDNISKETLNLIKSILSYVRSIYRIDLTGPEFLNQFGIHVSRLIQRLKSGKSIQNPMATQMKAQSPTVYECAVLISHKIASQVGVEVPDNEIAYIAMHIGNAIAKQIEDNERLKVIIVVPDYQDKFLSIVDQIDKNFNNELSILKVVTEETDLSEKVDFLITLKNKINIDLPFVQISPFLTRTDNGNIRNKIEKIVNTKKQLTFDHQIGSFFDERFFKINRNLKDKENVINYISDVFYEENITKKDYREDLFERERMSSTAFGKIAIPHSLEMKALNTKGFIYINPHGITWGENKVYLVFALAVKKQDSEMFRNIFDRLSDVMIEGKNIATLVQSTSYDDFLNKLKSIM
ncbi:BglG family transcription antiterminator [Pediococcus pentosaceus]|uniref:BglG family transcription antiterminator n=1 Tax=Pediococcus pentosaceus TaxID=1255 RepID=UPI001E45B62E|nr:PTS sugar transporter subunit IIA [Pediococcus pentosaceus]MCG7196810.1 PRD domain-containing protein [Pediococcus pentosaceus]MCI2396791.1 PRD domain-containing protein [Pediococcus pentosaceus]